MHWQLAKRRAGHAQGQDPRRGQPAPARKLYKQKGTGRARHGSRRVASFRGGGVTFGPSPRDHAIDLPKKVRALGLQDARCRASSPTASSMVLDEASLAEPKTKQLAGRARQARLESALVITGAEVERNFALRGAQPAADRRAAGAGLNVYDILRRDTLVLTQDAVQQLEERLA